MFFRISTNLILPPNSKVQRGQRDGTNRCLLARGPCTVDCPVCGNSYGLNSDDPQTGQSTVHRARAPTP